MVLVDFPLSWTSHVDPCLSWEPGEPGDANSPGRFGPVLIMPRVMSLRGFDMFPIVNFDDEFDDIQSQPEYEAGKTWKPIMQGTTGVQAT